jgi:hypothetical protein
MVKTSETETKSCLCQVFNFKLDRFAAKDIKCMAWKQPLLELKIWSRIYPLNKECQEFGDG